MKLADLHCDTLWACCQVSGTDLGENQLHVDLNRGMRYSPWIQCFAAWIEDQYRGESAWDVFCRMKDFLYEALQVHGDRMYLIRSGEDLQKAEEQKKCAVLFTVEGGAAAAGSLEKLQKLYDFGVRMMTLTWNGKNEWGGGAEEPGPLTPFGKEAVRRMEQLGMQIDLSHASDPLFWSVVEETTGPLIASHSNSRKICRHKRNLTDEQFSLICRRKGLVGLNFTRSFLRKKGKKAVCEDILRHAEHFLSLGGQDVLAIGSDFDGTVVPDSIRGIESMEDLANLFLHHGYSETLVEKIFFQNVRNFFLAL